MYVGIRRDLLHSSYSHDSQVRLAGEILSLGVHFFNPCRTPAGGGGGGGGGEGRWGYTLIGAIAIFISRAFAGQL